MDKIQRNSKKKDAGFTLIELLVVISIIGTLSTVAMTSLNSARAKARDTRRLSDAEQIMLALEIYKNNHGYYPANTDNDSGGWDIGYTNQTGDAFIKPLVDDGLFSATPGDPTKKGTAAYYYHHYPAGSYGWCDPSMGEFYILNITFETASYNAKKPGFKCPAGTTWNGNSWSGWGKLQND